MCKSYNTLIQDLTTLGLEKGDVVIVHSSLSSMGMVEGGAETVIRALTDLLGDDGTLLMPTFTYRTVSAENCFSHADTPVCVGTIPETFRKMPGVLRSVHPTHSVGAYGKLAREMTKNHRKDDTPMGINSPYRKLAECDAKILMLGCTLRPMSFMHALEEEAGALYCLTPYKILYTITDDNGKTYQKNYRKHYFVRPDLTIKQCYSRCKDVLTEGADYTKGFIHGSESYLVKAKQLHDKALLKMKDEPYYFVDVIENK